MARKRTEARSIISTEGSAPAPIARRRTKHVTPAQHTPETADTETLNAQATAVGAAVDTEPISEREEIAKLAYCFWLDRGGQGGSAEEDWVRAEQEFHRRREASTS